LRDELGLFAAPLEGEVEPCHTSNDRSRYNFDVLGLEHLIFTKAKRSSIRLNDVPYFKKSRVDFSYTIATWVESFFSSHILCKHTLQVRVPKL